jgi:hypothetical protein
MGRKDQGTMTVDREGVTYVGDWSVAKSMLTVTLRGGKSSTTQLGGSASAPKSLAKIMLGQLVDARASKRKLK